MSEIYVGLMSGTSADGLDACLVRFRDRECEILGHVHRAYPQGLRTRLLTAMHNTSLAAAADLDVELANVAGAAISDLLAQTGYSASEITAIGSHGQTVLHRPDTATPTSIQLGDPHRLAILCGIDVVADFRRADVAAGGEGAPLAPGFHAWALATETEARAVLNIGGMANLTLLPTNGEPVIGFDTGPGNVLLDYWSERTTGQAMDDGGARAATGTVDAALLQRLEEDPYFDRRPPKSTGREHFNAEWLEQRLHERNLAATAEHVQATLSELTASTIATALQREAPATRRVLVCGGGIENADLMARLRRRLPELPIESTGEYGVPPQQVESVAFAWLARQRIHERPGNIPSVTGADRELVLGAHVHGRR